jgi:hypothetical protein
MLTLPVQLVVMVGVAGLDVLLPAVEDGLACEQLGEDAADGPNVDGLKAETIKNAPSYRSSDMVPHKYQLDPEYSSLDPVPDPTLVNYTGLTIPIRNLKNPVFENNSL